MNSTENVISVKDLLHRLNVVSQSIIAINRCLLEVSYVRSAIEDLHTTETFQNTLREQLSILDKEQISLFQDLNEIKELDEKAEYVKLSLRVPVESVNEIV